ETHPEDDEERPGQTIGGQGPGVRGQGPGPHPPPAHPSYIPVMATVFLTGASGFMGRRLAAELLLRGHTVRGMVRRGSESQAAPGCEVVVADPLDAASYRDRVCGCDTFVHLVGVSHPSPAKAAQFRSIDLASAKAAVSAAAAAGVRHFVY